MLYLREGNLGHSITDSAQSAKKLFTQFNSDVAFYHATMPLLAKVACYCKSSTIFSSWATDKLLKNVVTLAALILLVSYSPTLVHTDEFCELEGV